MSERRRAPYRAKRQRRSRQGREGRCDLRQPSRDEVQARRYQGANMNAVPDEWLDDYHSDNREGLPLMLRASARLQCVPHKLGLTHSPDGLSFRRHASACGLVWNDTGTCLAAVAVAAAAATRREIDHVPWPPFTIWRLFVPHAFLLPIVTSTFTFRALSKSTGLTVLARGRSVAVCHRCSEQHNIPSRSPHPGSRK